MGQTYNIDLKGVPKYNVIGLEIGSLARVSLFGNCCPRIVHCQFSMIVR